MRHLKADIYQARDAMDRLGSIAAISSDLKFMSVADSFTDLFGYTEDDVRGRELHFLDYAGIQSVLLKQMFRQLYSGGTWIGDVTCRHKDGSSIEVRISIAPSIHNGEIVSYLAQYQRSHVHPNHFELSDVLYRYRAGFNKIAALAIVTSTGQIQEVNDLFVDLYGYERSEIVGQQVSTLRSMNTSREQHSRLWSTVLGGQIWSEEIENRRKNGDRIFVRCTVAPATNLTQDVVASFDAFLVIYQDITQETELRANQKEMAIETARQQMLAGTIHNIGNLQQSVVSANDKTLQCTQGLVVACQQATDYFKTIESREDCDLFIAGVLGIVHATASQISVSAQAERKAIDDTISVLHSFRRHQKNVRPVDDESISAFVQRTLNTFSLQAAQHHIAIWIAAMTEVDVRWPIAQVQQIVFNLLINAQEAICGRILSGEIAAHRGRIDLSITQVGEDIYFGVKDNGGGFNVSLDQLFTPRFTTKKRGSGIGLHTSAIMAQSMGGTLTAENVEVVGQRGALFVLQLPRTIEAQGAVIA